MAAARARMRSWTAAPRSTQATTTRTTRSTSAAKDSPGSSTGGRISARSSGRIDRAGGLIGAGGRTHAPVAVAPPRVARAVRDVARAAAGLAVGALCVRPRASSRGGMGRAGKFVAARTVAAALPVVGVAGVWLTRFEGDEKGWIYTPNRWLVLGLTSIVAARVIAGLWMAFRHVAGDA